MRKRGLENRGMEKTEVEKKIERTGTLMEAEEKGERKGERREERGGNRWERRVAGRVERKGKKYNRLHGLNTE